MKKTVSAVVTLLSAVVLSFAGCGNKQPHDSVDSSVVTTNFDELASYYDELAKGDIAVEVETTSEKNTYYEFSGDKNLLPEGIYEKLADIVKSRYTAMYGKYGKNFGTPKLTLVIDVGYSAESACHASGHTVFINPNWFIDHPDDCEELLSAMFKTMQDYEGAYPEWIETALQAYARLEFKTQYADEDWQIPGSYEGNSYEEGGVYGAALLKWIDDRNEQDIIYRLNKALLDGNYKESFWKTETGLTFGQLWGLYIGGDVHE